MAYTGQSKQSLKAELKLYDAFLKNSCSIENDEVQAAIQEAWGSDSDWTKEHKIIVLKESSPAVIEYRIQANKEMLAMYEDAESEKESVAPAPEIEPEDEDWQDELFEI